MNSEQKILLTPFTEAHISQTYNWVKDPDLQRLFLMRGEITLQGHQAYFARVMSDESQQIYAVLADECHIGNCGLKNILLPEKEAELWIYIGDTSMRSRGIGKYATQLLLYKGFKVLGLNMIYIHVADFNVVARKIYEQIGFMEVPLKGNVSEWANRGCIILRMELKGSLWMSR